MKQSELLKRIEELEKRVKELEDRPPQHFHYHYPQYQPVAPMYPYPLYPTWTSGTVTADAIGNPCPDGVHYYAVHESSN